MLNLFVRKWDIFYCVKIFDTLTRQFFRRRTHGSRSLIQQIRHVFKCWWSDSYYDIRSLENSLKEYFETEQRIFDHTENTSNVKIVVTATTISNASPYFFSSYNGFSVRSKNCNTLFRYIAIKIILRISKLQASSPRENWEWVLYMRSVNTRSFITRPVDDE